MGRVKTPMTREDVIREVSNTLERFTRKVNLAKELGMIEQDEQVEINIALGNAWMCVAGLSENMVAAVELENAVYGRLVGYPADEAGMEILQDRIAKGKTKLLS